MFFASLSHLQSSSVIKISGQGQKESNVVMSFPRKQGSKLCCLKQSATTKFTDSPNFSKKQIKGVVLQGCGVSFGFIQEINSRYCRIAEHARD